MHTTTHSGPSTILRSADGRRSVLVVRVGHPRAARGEYLGRAGKGSTGSPLANPRRLGDRKPGGGVWERGETLEHYRAELREVLDERVEVARWNGEPLTAGRRAAIRAEVARLRAKLERDEELVLVCFCAPQGCHADEVAAFILSEPAPAPALPTKETP